jgi:phosphate transport system permease protein
MDISTDGRRLRRRQASQKAFFSIFRMAAMINAAALIIVGFFIIYRGVGSISWEFLTRAPYDSMTKGGIMPCIVGTFYLAAGALIFAMPVGVAAAIYMNEYAVQGRMLRVIRFGINTLAGVPSIVFGLFGLAFFCIVLKFGVSILAGCLTLGVMTLPVIIGTTEEALKAVPDTYREASLGLGATQWQTIYRVVIPAAMPEILTGAILGLGRAAGETAPIMFTAAVFYTPILPTSIFDKVMALPYHIYALATEGREIAVTGPLQYGSALVLIVLVCGMNLFAIITRARLRRKLKG